MRDYFQGSEFFGKKTNSLLSALISVYLLANCISILLNGNLTWFLYGLSVTVLVFIPPIVLRDYNAFVPFEILLLLAMPFTVKGLSLGFIAASTLTYFTAGTVSLLLITELDTFTSFKTTWSFAVFLTAMSTVSVAGIWAIARWISDIYLGSSIMVTEHTLMWEFFSALLAGVFAGGVFNIYFRRRDRRLKNEIEAV